MPYVDVTDAFCADPEGFMNNNIVIQKINSSDAGIIAVKVFASPDAKIGNMVGGKVCVMMEARRGDTPALPAYWCPYTQNELKSAMLGDGALYAFTPTMDGCSIGLGSGANAQQMLCHVNSAAIGAEWSSGGRDLNSLRARQSQSQSAQLRAKLGPNAAIANPADYRLDGTGDHSMSSTTFGVHALGRPWRLRTLRYRKMGTITYFHGGVHAF